MNAYAVKPYRSDPDVWGYDKISPKEIHNYATEQDAKAFVGVEASENTKIYCWDIVLRKGKTEELIERIINPNYDIC